MKPSFEKGKKKCNQVEDFRCQLHWDHEQSPAVGNQSSGIRNNSPSSCSRWETEQPRRPRHRLCKVSAPTENLEGRSPWTLSDWTTRLGWGASEWGGRAVTTGDSTWCLVIRMSQWWQQSTSQYEISPLHIQLFTNQVISLHKTWEYCSRKSWQKRKRGKKWQVSNIFWGFLFYICIAY